jgi:hypothetical protein
LLAVMLRSGDGVSHVFLVPINAVETLAAMKKDAGPSQRIG